MRLVKIVFISFFLGIAPLMACDVNLFSIISGVSINDAFSEKMNGLASAIKSLGDNYTNDKKSQEKLNILMNSWLGFSSAFSQFPPEWARNDQEWPKKIVELGNIIGDIRRHLGKDNENAHRAMLKFSRRLPQLYQHMPMDDKARLLLEFTACFDRIWDAYYTQDHDLLKSGATELVNKCKELRHMLKDSYKTDIDMLDKFIERLRASSTQINAFKTTTLQFFIIDAEGQFVLMNEKFSKKQPEPRENSNSTDD